MMGIYPKISNGIVALRVRDGKLGELCTAHCSNTHVEDNLQWFLKRDPHNPTRRIYMSNKGEATWDIPISSLPTVEEKEVWNRHPTFVSLQRSRDGWAWYTANVGRLLPSYRDIEVEEADDPMPYLGDAGFYSYSQLPRVEAEPAHDVDLPREVPFVPQSMLDDDFQPELPPPPARGPRHIQGEIQLPESVREEILRTDHRQLDVELAPEDGGEIPSPELAEDINQTQPVESQEPAIGGEGVTSIPQIGAGYLKSLDNLANHHHHLQVHCHPCKYLNGLPHYLESHFNVNLLQKKRILFLETIWMIPWIGFNNRNQRGGDLQDSCGQERLVAFHGTPSMDIECMMSVKGRSRKRSGNHSH